MGALARFARETWASLFPSHREGSLAACDGVRSLALFGVLACHSSFGWEPNYDPWYDGTYKNITDRPGVLFVFNLHYAGEVGVDMFLVLSGFLIGTSLIREVEESGGINFLRFYVRRLFRIVPAYFFAAQYSIIMDCPAGARQRSTGFWWVNLLFVNNMLLKEDGTPAILGQSWTIALEMQLYFVTPFVFLGSALLARIFPNSMSIADGVTGACAFAFLVTVALRLYVTLTMSSEDAAFSFPGRLYFHTQYRYGAYVAGVMAAMHVWNAAKSSKPFVGMKGRTLAPAACLQPVALTLIVFAFCTGGDGQILNDVLGASYSALGRVQWAFQRPFFAIAVAYVLALCVTGRSPLLCGALAARGWRPFAVLSYSMYLVQFMAAWYFDVYVCRVIAHALGDRTLPLWLDWLVMYANTLMYALSTLPAAFLLYSLVERPGIIVGKLVVGCLEDARRCCAAEADSDGSESSGDSKDET